MRRRPALRAAVPSVALPSLPQGDLIPANGSLSGFGSGSTPVSLLVGVRSEPRGNHSLRLHAGQACPNSVLPTTGSSTAG